MASVRPGRVSGGEEEKKKKRQHSEMVAKSFAECTEVRSPQFLDLQQTPACPPCAQKETGVCGHHHRSPGTNSERLVEASVRAPGWMEQFPE